MKKTILLLVMALFCYNSKAQKTIKEWSEYDDFDGVKAFDGTRPVGSDTIQIYPVHRMSPMEERLANERKRNKQRGQVQTILAVEGQVA